MRGGGWWGLNSEQAWERIRAAGIAVGAALGGDLDLMSLSPDVYLSGLGLGLVVISVSSALSCFVIWDEWMQCL